MSTKNEICNMALAHLGIGKSVTDISTDRTAEADALEKFYDAARDATLRDVRWPFATKIAALAESADSVPGAGEAWVYAYTYPSDCLRILRIHQDGRRVDSYDNATAYRIVRGATEKLICTDQETAYLEYVYQVTDEELFSEDFAIAFSYRLAIYIAPRLTGGSYGSVMQNITSMYGYHIGRAMQNAANEAGTDAVPESEYIRARG